MFLPGAEKAKWYESRRESIRDAEEKKKEERATEGQMTSNHNARQKQLKIIARRHSTQVQEWLFKIGSGKSWRGQRNWNSTVSLLRMWQWCSCFRESMGETPTAIGTRSIGTSTSGLWLCTLEAEVMFWRQWWFIEDNSWSMNEGPEHKSPFLCPDDESSEFTLFGCGRVNRCNFQLSQTILLPRH